MMNEIYSPFMDGDSSVCALLQTSHFLTDLQDRVVTNMASCRARNKREVAEGITQGSCFDE